MRPTPSLTEANIKERIRGVLNRHAPVAYYEMHVPYGYGKRPLDFNVCVAGFACYIEAKRPGKYPTPQQRQTLKRAFEAGAAVFVISNYDGIDALDRWVRRMLHAPRGV